MSTVGSLGSLSSAPPSPDPSHPPTPKRTSLHTAQASEPVGSDSELSELTDDDGDDGDNSHSRRSTSSKPVRRTVRRKRSNIVPPEPWGWAYKGGKKPEDPNAEEEEEEEEEEHSGPPTAMEEEEEEDHDERPGSRRRGIEVVRADPAVVNDELDLAEDDNDASSDASNDDMDIDDKDMRDDAGSPDLTDEDASDVDVEDEGPSGIRTPADPQDVESEEEADAEDAEAESEDDEPDIAEETQIRAAAVLAATVAEADVDLTAPPPSAIQPVVEKAATLSIMAGASAPTLGVANPESPSASTTSTPSSSRSGSPDPASTSKSPREKPSEEERTSAKDLVKTKPQEEKEEQVDVDDAEADEPELDLEMDLQPAHRAEALDAIAVIELKYATLREQLYVEKMHALAWEESLVKGGHHPEMLYLHDELLKRRDRRLELASRRRDYEVDNVARKRKADEALVWSTWKFQRDQLQTDMIAENNRKRRKLERERRSLERPQPLRRIPHQPREVPPAPSLREILRKTPFISASEQLSAKSFRSKRHAFSALESANPEDFTFPSLASLRVEEVATDLDFLAQNKRPFEHQHLQHLHNPRVIAGPNHSLGPMVPPNPYDSYGPASGMIDPRAYDVHGIGGQKALLNTLVPLHGPPGTQYPPYPIPGSSKQHPLAFDQDVGPGPFGHALGPGAMSGPPGHLRRSSSPSHGRDHGVGSSALPNGHVAKSNGWAGGKPPTLNEWPRDAPRAEFDEELRSRDKEVMERQQANQKAKVREREKDRDMERQREVERQRELEHDERERLVQIQQQQQQQSQAQSQALRHQHISHSLGVVHQHPHPHQHVHATQYQHVGPHHHHHHHHVHHHHPPSSQPSISEPGPAIGPGVPPPARERDRDRLVAGSQTREPEQAASTRSYTGTPTEVINLTSSPNTTKHLARSPYMAFDDRDSGPADFARERERLPTVVQDERPVFAGTHRLSGPPSAAGSLLGSPRGVYAGDRERDDREGTSGRPASSSMSTTGQGSLQVTAGLPHPRRDSSASSQSTSRLGSSMLSPHPSSHQLPPSSPSSFPGARSPVRSSLPLSGSSGSAALVTSPNMSMKEGRPASPIGTSKLPLGPGISFITGLGGPGRPGSPPLPTSSRNPNGPSLPTADRDHTISVRAGSPAPLLPPLQHHHSPSRLPATVPGGSISSRSTPIPVAEGR